MGELSENQAFMVLNALPHIGPCTVKKLLAHFRGDVRGIFSATPDQLKSAANLDAHVIDCIVKHSKYFDLRREEKELAALRGRFLSINSDTYPFLLGKISDAPTGIYVIGNLSNSSKNIAIIGSRTTTIYGLEIARMLAMELAKRGFCIVSGMARGIDSAAHEGALAGGGETVAVLGNGINIVYPIENAALYRRISGNGAVISEFPLGRRADRQTFPIRNRLIAGLCHAIIVVESDKFGGSMITARFAAEYGRHVFAVPGRIDQPSSAGCLALIKDGATMLTCVDDIFTDLPYLSDAPKQQTLGIAEPDGKIFPQRGPEISCPIERKIYEVLTNEKSATLDAIITISELPSKRVINSLQMLEIRGITARRYDGLFEVKKTMVV